MLLEFQYFAVDVVTGVSIEAGNQRISPPTSQSLPPTFYIQFHLSCYITVILILLLNLMPEYRKWYTPYSKMAANKLFFCLHVYQPSLPHFHFKILLCFLHADEASRAN